MDRQGNGRDSAVVASTIVLGWVGLSAPDDAPLAALIVPKDPPTAVKTVTAQPAQVPKKARPPLDPQVVLSRLQTLRDDIVRALSDRSFGTLRSLAKRALVLSVTKEALLSTGMGILMKDRSLWSLCPSKGDERPVADIAEEAVAKWRMALTKGRGALPLEREAKDIEALAAADCWKPLGNMRCSQFMRAVDVLTQYAKSVDSARDGVSARAAFHLALLGIERPEDLSALSTDAVRNTGLSAPVVTVGSNMIIAAHWHARKQAAVAEAARVADEAALLA